MGKGGDKQHVPVEAPDSLKSQQRLRIIDMLGEGEIEGPVNGLKSVYLDDTPIQNADGSYNFSGLSAAWVNGSQAQPPLKGFPAVENEVAVGLKVEKDKPIIRTVTDPEIDRIRVTIGVQGLKQVEENGDTNPTSVVLSVQVKIGSGWSSVRDVEISGKTNSQYLRNVELTDLPAAPFSFRVVRATDDSTSQRLVNDTIFSSYTEIQDVRLSYPNTALVGLTFDSSQFSGVPRRNYLIRGRRVKVPSNYNPQSRQYTGLWDGTFKVAWSNNPAWVFYDLATCTRVGIGKRIDQQVDKWMLYSVSQYCDQLVDDGFGGLEPRMTCNCTIHDAQQAYTVFTSLASVFRALPCWTGTELSVTPDVPADPVWSYSNANVKDGKFSYQSSGSKARYTAVQVDYLNPDNGWKKSTEYVADDELIARYGLKIKPMEAWGCTSRGQARRAGKWFLITGKLERQSVTFTLAREGLKHLPGDVIEVADNFFSGAQLAGRVLAVEGKTVTLDREVEIKPGESTSLGFINEQGKSERITVFSHPSPETLVLDKEPRGLEEFGVWTLSTVSLAPRLFRCLDISEQDGEYTVTALEHVPEKHDIIEKGIKFDPPDNTLYGGNIPPVERLQVEALPDSELYQIRMTWDTPRTITGLVFEVKIKRGKAVATRNIVESTEFMLGDLREGSYTARVRGRNGQGQLGPETMVSFTISAPAVPVDIETEADNFSITARPVIDGPTALGTQYEWYFGQTQAAVSNRLTPLGRAFILNKQALKPDTQYWLGVEAVNAVGRSGLLTKAVRTLLKPDDILQIIGPEIPKLDWAKELDQMVEDNSAAVVLLGNRAALVVNQDGRVSGMTVTASSQASAIDFMADFVSFTDPETKKRNLYWDNALKTLVMKGQIKLLDGHTISGLGDIRAQDGDTIYTEFQFSSDGSGWHFPDQPGDIYLRSRVVTNGSAAAWGAVTNLKGDKGDDATERYTWVKYADAVDGSGMSDSPAGKAYLGIAYNRTAPTESTNPADYAWSKTKGETGVDGDTIYTEFQFSSDGASWHFPEQPGDIYLRSRVITNEAAGAWGAVTNLKGDKGDDATERYTWFKYADAADGSGMSDDGSGKAYLGVAYNRTTPTESTNPADYAWTKVKGEDGVSGQPGAGVFRLQTDTGVFPSDTATASALFAGHVGRQPVQDDVLSVYSVDESGYVSQADSRMYDGAVWVVPKMFIDGDLIALGTVRGEHIVAGVELRAPKIRGGDLGLGEGGPFDGYHTFIDQYGHLRTDNIYATGGTFKGRIEASSGFFKGSITGASGTFSGSVKAEKIIGDVVNGAVFTNNAASISGGSTKTIKTLEVKDASPKKRYVHITSPVHNYFGGMDYQLTWSGGSGPKVYNRGGGDSITVSAVIPAKFKGKLYLKARNNASSGSKSFPAVAGWFVGLGTVSTQLKIT